MTRDMQMVLYSKRFQLYAIQNLQMNIPNSATWIVIIAVIVSLSVNK